MSALVAAVAQKVCRRCHAKRCRKENCSILLNDAPAQRLIVDLDISILPIPRNRKRCDYLFFGEQDGTAWVVPIELKSGGFNGEEVVKQLQGGADIAHAWLPHGSQFRFGPVLAHRGSVHRQDLNKLRYKKINLRGQGKRIELLRCREKLINVLS